MSWPQSTDFPETEERAYGMDLKGNENPRKLTFSYSWFLGKRLPLLWNATSRHPSFTPSIFVFFIFIDILLFSCETKLLTIIWEPQLVESVCLCHKIKKQKHIFRVLISRASLPPFFFSTFALFQHAGYTARCGLPLWKYSCKWQSSIQTRKFLRQAKCAREVLKVIHKFTNRHNKTFKGAKLYFVG